MSDGLLLLLAHPDDESFMAGGTIRALADRGVRVALVCATRGQLGSAGDPPLCPRDELAALRERELHAACAILGVAHVEVLGYHDQQLASAPPNEIRAALVRALRRERPRVVITFDPNGVNGHADHCAISRFALDAVTAAADDRWLPEAGPAHRVARVVWPSPVFPWDEWRPDVLASIGGVDFVVDTARTRDAKAAALRAHRTQHKSVESRWFAPAESEGILSTETFRHGLGAPLSVRPGSDLFEGL